MFWTAGLYADSALQIVYLGLAAYGWWAWLRGGVAHTTLRVNRTTQQRWVALAAIGTAGTAVLTWVLSTNTDSTVPLPDAVTTYKVLWLTAARYAGFLALCVLGLRNWLADYRAAAGSPAGAATGQPSGSGPSATS